MWLSSPPRTQGARAGLQCRCTLAGFVGAAGDLESSVEFRELYRVYTGPPDFFPASLSCPHQAENRVGLSLSLDYGTGSRRSPLRRAGLASLRPRRRKCG